MAKDEIVYDYISLFAKLNELVNNFNMKGISSRLNIILKQQLTLTTPSPLFFHFKQLS